jgi:hypothetical protein
MSKDKELVMKVNFAGLALVIGIGVMSGFAQGSLADSAALTSSAQTLSALPFDSGTTVTVHARVASVVWPERAAGMVVVEVPGAPAKYAFSTAGVPAMARQGFTRFVLKPGDEIIVTGVLANGNLKIGPGFNAARADLITRPDGTHLFDRTRVAVK